MIFRAIALAGALSSPLLVHHDHPLLGNDLVVGPAAKWQAICVDLRRDPTIPPGATIFVTLAFAGTRDRTYFLCTSLIKHSPVAVERYVELP